MGRRKISSQGLSSCDTRIRPDEDQVQGFGRSVFGSRKARMSHSPRTFRQRNFNPLRNYLGLSRSSAHSHYRACLAEQNVSPKAPTYKKLLSLLDIRLVRAGLRFAKTFFTRRCKFQDYDYRAGESSVFPLQTNSTVGQNS